MELSFHQQIFKVYYVFCYYSGFVPDDNVSKEFLKPWVIPHQIQHDSKLFRLSIVFFHFWRLQGYFWRLKFLKNSFSFHQQNWPIIPEIECFEL